MTRAPAYVLDASALLALLHREPGAGVVGPLVGESAISAVNLCEVLQGAIAHGVRPEGVRADLEALDLTVVPFGPEDAESAALLWPATRSAGLSLGDRACLALALRLGAVAVTADRAWEGLDLGLELRLVR